MKSNTSLRGDWRLRRGLERQAGSPLATRCAARFERRAFEATAVEVAEPEGRDA